MEEKNKTFSPDVMGENIKKKRIEAGLTQEQVALKLRMKRETYNTIENGSRKLKDHEIVEIANLLNTTTDFILRDVDSGNADVCQQTGLSNSAVSYLKMLKKNADEMKGDHIRIRNVVTSILNLLLSSDQGRKVLRGIADYIQLDFSVPYINYVGKDGHFMEADALNGRIGFIGSVDGSGEYHHAIPLELMEQAELSLLMEDVKKLKHSEPPKQIKRVRRAKE